MESAVSKLLIIYLPSSETSELVSTTPIVLLVGISGAGKDTIKHHLLKTDKYHHIVSHTTRPARKNAGVMECDGEDYYFISHDTAADMITGGAFVEVKQYGNNVYGTSVAEIKQAKAEHRIAITDIEVQGVTEYKAISEGVIAIFILPPTYQEWQRRLHARYLPGEADPADIAKRMQTAIIELEDALAKPYYHFVINEDLSETIEIVDKIAHNHDQFNTVDAAVYGQAQQLLADLKHAI